MILLISAFHLESRYLVNQALKKTTKNTNKNTKIGALNIRYGMLAQHLCGVCYCGVGVSVGIPLVMKALRVLRPTLVLNVGCAGALTRTLTYGTVCIPTGYRYVSSVPPMVSPHTIASAFPSVFPLVFSDALSLTGVKAERGLLATSGYAVVSAYERQRIAKHYHATAVDMEAAILASLAGHYNIPFLAIKWISDTFCGYANMAPPSSVPTTILALVPHIIGAMPNDTAQ